MKKRGIIGLVILMSVSLLGIITLQGYWFTNSVRVSNDLFDRSVNEAMMKAVKRMETGNDLHLIHTIIRQDSLIYPDLPVPPPPIPEDPNLDVEIHRDSINGMLKVTTRHKTNVIKSGRKATQIIISNEGITSGSFQKEIHHLQDSMKKQFDMLKIRVDSKKVAQLAKLGKQFALEFHDFQEGKSIDEKTLNRYLKEELADREIPIPFSMQIEKPEKYTSIQNQKVSHIKQYKINLFPDDLLRKNLSLSINFTDRDAFITRKMIPLLFLSIAFTMVILVTFLLSLLMIIRQKKIADMKSDFINNMTHEFKTPLATISIAADSIVNDKIIDKSDQVRFFAGMIKKENQRLNSHVERILRIARLDRKENDFHFMACNVHDLIEEAIADISIQVTNRNGRIIHQFEASNPFATTDPSHFTSVIFNLLDNAIKYSENAPVITISTNNTEMGVSITVQDQGVGMTKTVQKHIFDQFYRLTTGNIHNTKGFGLGLSYVKAVVEANQGRIKVWSEPGKGSKFEIHIPFQINQP